MLPGSSSDRREMSRLLALSQVGFEMVAPIGVGLALDFWLNWLPWATLTGAVLGLTFGLFHLARMMNRENAAESSPPKRESR
jgi:F0F1-type ATP synthase assembly protein I